MYIREKKWENFETKLKKNIINKTSTFFCKLLQGVIEGKIARERKTSVYDIVKNIGCRTNEELKRKAERGIAANQS